MGAGWPFGRTVPADKATQWVLFENAEGELGYVTFCMHGCKSFQNLCTPRKVAPTAIPGELSVIFIGRPERGDLTMRILPSCRKIEMASHLWALPANTPLDPTRIHDMIVEIRFAPFGEDPSIEVISRGTCPVFEFVGVITTEYYCQGETASTEISKLLGLGTVMTMGSSGGSLDYVMARLAQTERFLDFGVKYV